MDLIKITELTTLLGISSRSLRYYEQMGLIKSVRPDFEKFRYFNSDNIERLKQIIALRKMQIPIKDIIRIYDSEDMSVVVDAFISRLNVIDDEVNALSDLKRIVNDFLQTMLKNGIKRISASFGPEAFRAWANNIDSGKFEGMTLEEFDAWANHTIYVCNLATNSGGCQGFLEKAQQLNPDLTFIEDIRKRFSRTGELWNDLEALGAGFNITLGALQDLSQRKAITDKIREFAVCMDEVLDHFKENNR